MKKAALLDVLRLIDHIAVSTTASGRDNILVEREGNEDDKDEEIYGGANGTHAFGDLGAMCLGEVAALEASLHEGGTEPADHGMAEREANDGEGQVGGQRLAVAMKGVGKNDSSCEDGRGV